MNPFPTLQPGAACPCEPRNRYADCCGRFHAGPLRGLAPDAEALMRSRYSAFVLGLRDYLLETWHPDHRPPRIEADPPGLTWLGLQVKRQVLQDAEHATVEFVARSKLAGRAHRHHELSRFQRLEGRWLYLDGEPGMETSVGSAEPGRARQAEAGTDQGRKGLRGPRNSSRQRV